MHQRLADILCCPMCGGALAPSNCRSRGGRIISAELVCGSGLHRYPVVMERPVLLPKGAVDRWLSPIDEALGLTGAETAVPFSFPRLRELGISSALSMLQEGELDDDAPEKGVPWNALSLVNRGLRNKASYRRSGRFLDHRGRREKLLKPFAKLPERCRLWALQVLRAKPESVLDIASGGGGGVSVLIRAGVKPKLLCSTERDLRCTWTVQRGARELGFDNLEAVGADVRRLPFDSGSFDAVTSLAALQEVLGMRRLTTEIARVLRPGGSWFAIYSEPETWGEIGIDQYMDFAEATDMYRGHHALLETARQAGLYTEAVQECGAVRNGRHVRYWITEFTLPTR